MHPEGLVFNKNFRVEIGTLKCRSGLTTRKLHNNNTADFMLPGVDLTISCHNVCVQWHILCELCEMGTTP